MPADRTQPAPGAEEAPAANGEAAAPKPASGGFKAWLPLIITIVLMPVLAYGMTQYVLLPRLQHGLGITPAEGGSHSEKKKEAPTGKKESVTMNKLLVNVAGTMGARYLLVSISVEGVGDTFPVKMKEADPKLRDMAMGALRTKTLADLEKPGAVNLIRAELLSGFNNILGEAMVQDIYITEFAIQ
jgi:flagellar FliL protein